MKLKLEWISGNRVDLLENGDAYLPAIFQAIDAAEHEVLIETFILFEDRVGHNLQQHLIDAGGRGVEVDLTVDGFGSPDLSDALISALTDASVRLHVYEPIPFVRQLNPPRRLHRKITVIDGRVAFIGGNVAFVSRDNHDHRADIERAYRMAIRAGASRCGSPTPTFSPVYRMLRDLRRATSRGVAVPWSTVSGPPSVRAISTRSACH